MLVPTIQGIPVLLPAHDHPSFGSPGLHYHIDYRFLEDPPLQARVLWPKDGEEPVMVELPMLRECYDIQVQAVKVLRHLTAIYIGEQAKCGKCPHKGMPVMNGVCVGHGLCFNAEGFVEHNLEIGFDWERQPYVMYKDYYVFTPKQDLDALGDLKVWAGGRHVQTLGFEARSWGSVVGDEIRISVK